MPIRERDAVWEATLREQSLEVLRQHACTADEVAEEVGSTVLAIRPRISELRQDGLIRDTGERRINGSGRKAAVWMAQ